MKIVELLKGKPPPAETLRAALAEVEAEATAVDGEMAGLREKRQALLINGFNHEKLDEVEGELTVAYRRQDRAELLIGSLKERLELAEQAERAAEADQIHAEAIAKQKRGLELLERYGQLATEMVSVLTELEAGEALIRSSSARLHARGDTRIVESAESQYWPVEAVPQFPPWQIAQRVVLPDPKKIRAFVWPPSA